MGHPENQRETIKDQGAIRRRAWIVIGGLPCVGRVMIARENLHFIAAVRLFDKTPAGILPTISMDLTTGIETI